MAKRPTPIWVSGTVLFVPVRGRSPPVPPVPPPPAAEPRTVMVLLRTTSPHVLVIVWVPTEASLGIVTASENAPPPSAVVEPNAVDPSKVVLTPELAGQPVPDTVIV